jgi:hypothetical protein
MPLILTGLSLAQGTPPDAQTLNATHIMCDAAAAKLRDAGTSKIVLVMTVDPKGQVESFRTDSPKGLRLEKMKEPSRAIKGIRFTPASKDGSPVAVLVSVEYDCASPPLVRK